jgi:hypothetical protein
MITRPDVIYDDASHSYTLNGEKLLGVSTIAKIGDDAWGPASWWGWRLGYEAASEVYDPGKLTFTVEELRGELKRRKLTPNAKRNKRGQEGTWTHDALEALAQDGTVSDLTKYPEKVRGHVRGFLRWYLDYRPVFVATEVQVVSVRHGFAGRYDIRCVMPGTKLGLKQDPPNEKWCVECQPDPPDDSTDMVCSGCNTEAVLCLVDLKTSKGVYPTSHFPQLAGYELAGVEMGFSPTDAQYVLNTHEEGTYDLVRSCATPEHFLAYLAAEKAKREIQALAPARSGRPPRASQGTPR